MIEYSIFGTTRCGKKHSENQDRMLRRCIDWPQPMGPVYLVGVADGVSRTPYGGSVARWVIDRNLATEAVFKAQADPLASQLRSYLLSLVEGFIAEHKDNSAMLDSGAALSVAGVQGAYAECFYAGDAPIFISRISNQYAGEQVSRPDINQYRELTNYFGGGDAFQPHHTQVRLGEGDVLTIASDGANIDEYVLQEFYLKKDCSDLTLNAIADMALKSPASDDVSIVALVRRT